jgi:hypothetical protein
MTSIVAIRCTDGVVIGADSSATFGDGAFSRTIEQNTDTKIQIVGNSTKFIIAGTGYVGHHQRYTEAVRQANAKKELVATSETEMAKHLSRVGVNDFSQSFIPDHLKHIPYSAFVAFKIGNMPCLIELSGPGGFQPEIKRVDDLWFTSSGSGQSITDPFLALFRSVFWSQSAPDVKGGIFTAYWALHHACEINPGGIKAPIRMAVLAPPAKGGQLEASMLSEDDLQETRDLVTAATQHFGQFRETLLGKAGVSEPPKLPPAPV